MRIDVADLTDTAAYRILTDSVVPRPVAWVSTLGPDGARNLAPFSFFQAIGGAPPTVIISVGRHGDGDRKDSAANAMAAGELVVNIVSEDLLEQMNATSGDYLSDVDEFDVAGVTAAACEHVAAPRVAEAPVSFECRVSSSVVIGRDEPSDYVLLICEVVAFHVRDGLLVDGRIDPALLRPICRLGGTGFARLGEIIHLARPRIPRS
jgi:flavin reductase (DIM6/NTAB) family NADH-FMN oxidoreductase RutF